ncbi:MAG: protoheme IX farnesyltransferase [SAR324 cluster bacterium]|nr:protoheme IX farnesyltransferase [SAR324 cluster bacterium]MBL7034566.1 protoheme IX farnesyltransferase [SAR324 cluster bacterium]
MKTKVNSITNYKTIPASKIKDYITLTKPRLLFSVLFSTVLGYIIPVDGMVDSFVLLNLLIGTALIGAGAHTLNQWQEQIPDSKMSRTKNRPLPMGRLSRSEVFVFGILISIGGFLTLWLSLNLLTASLGLLTLISYVLIYTPLKTRTTANTWFGGITGALPPVMGWTAARGQLDWEVLPIFALLYFWQLPHFFAIAWMYRDDYRKAGFKMLSLEDSNGHNTRVQMLLYGLLLFATSAVIYMIGQGSLLYLIGSILLGISFLAVITLFFLESSVNNARKVFLASIIYLPVLSTVLVLDRLFY